MAIYIENNVFSHYESSNTTIKRLAAIIKLTKVECTLYCDTYSRFLDRVLFKKESPIRQVLFKCPEQGNPSNILLHQ